MGGMVGAVKMSGTHPKDHRAVFLGAGSAGVGVAQQIVEFFMREGLTEEEAKKCFWFVDSQGLVTKDRPGKLAEHKVYFARDDNEGKQFKTLDEIVDYVKPTILMGLSTIGGAFTPEIIKKVAKMNNRPIIFPLSNPVSKAECTFEEAIVNTDGRCLFASGSPFYPFEYKGKTYHAGQGNNMFVFPGIGLGTILCKAIKVTQNMIYASGRALPTMITQEEADMGLIYPEITRIRAVSARVARDVIRAAQEDNVDRMHSLRDMTDEELEEWIQEKMYDPHKAVEAIEDELDNLAKDLAHTRQLSRENTMKL